MAVNINVPSQVKTYANLAAFPATGALKTIYIAEDTNKTYRWTGSVYVEVSASASGITIGSTAIASGSVGRILFEGAGNVVQESSSLFWDNTNARLQVGTGTPEDTLQANGALRLTGRTGNVQAVNQSALIDFVDTSIFATSPRTRIYAVGTGSISAQMSFNVGLAGTPIEALRIFGTGNIGVNTGTDAGFKLDVNGTARVQNDAIITRAQNANTTFTIENTTSGTVAQALLAIKSTSTSYIGKFSSSTTGYKFVASNDLYINNGVNGDLAFLNDHGPGRIKFGAGGSSTAQMTLFSTGNLGINTTTDAGYRLDVNGTARFVGNTFVNTGSSTSVGLSIGDSTTATLLSYFSGGLYFKVLNTNAMVLSSGASGGLVVGASGSQNTASARLQVDSTTQGFLPPRMTTTQKNAIATPATGLQVYDTTLNRPCFYDGTTWITL